MLRLLIVCLLTGVESYAQLRQVVDLDRNERVEVTLAGKAATVELIGTSEDRDALSNAIREARADVRVNGKSTTLKCGNYSLPVEFAGVQIDCPVTGAYVANSTADHWGLTKAARLRLWPAGSPWLEPGSLIYPVKQKWFATSTQMANEPTYVDGGERASRKRIYYHSGLDIGGAEGLIDVVAATDGLVASSGTAVMPEHAHGTPVSPRYDVIYLLDSRGWYYRYSHFASIEPGITPGTRVKQGQKIGVLGKEGGSGGWSHLHFEAVAKQPSGKWGTEEGYAYLWQAWLAESKADLIAVSRPHRVVYAGESVTLDGSRSWSRSGEIAKFEWFLTDGTRATGARVERRYDKPGYYSEILRVTGPRGRVAHDFAIVEVAHRPVSGTAELTPPTIHASFSPTTGIRRGQPIDFLVRTFRTTQGSEVWDFGDGTPTITVQSDGCVKPLAKDGYARTVHRYSKPGRYLASVRRMNERGEVAVARLEVVVEE